MRKLRALDLFCCAGGAGMGLHRAGFEVVGVDIRPQPRYPFEFHQADALTFPTDGFDFIWASPPCQAYSWSAKRWKDVERADLLDPIRQRLLKQPAPFELHGFWTMQPPNVKPGRIGFGPDDFVTVAGHGGDGSGRLSNWQDATGIDWMTKPEMAEAIPPAYSEFIGKAAIQHIESLKRRAA
jgi:DNA (cytosine-5)-methyltransferase 1